MTTSSMLLGALAGTGFWLITSWGFARRPSFRKRIEPQLRGSVRDELARTSHPSTPFPTLERLLSPVMRDAVAAVERWGSSAEELRVRLERAGTTLSVEQFRAEQVLWGVLGVCAGAAYSVLLAATRGSSPVALLMLTLFAGLAGVAARDYMLGRAAAKREARMLAELPTIAELLALAVSAGEGALGALERVCRSTHGDLADELSKTLADARAGAPLSTALESLAARSGFVALARFADGIAVAVERGTPLAEVLRAQAQDVREQGRRALMEEGGRKEIAMMIPVVFLILPVTVVFAVFPGLVAIQLGI